MIKNRRYVRKQCKKEARRAAAACRGGLGLGMLAITAVIVFAWLFKWAMMNILTQPYQKLIILIAVSLLKFLLIVPLVCGMSKLVYLSVTGKNAGATRVFYFFEGFRRYFKTVFLVLFVLVKSALIFAVPVVMAAGGFFVYRYFDAFDIYTLFLLFLIIVSVIITFHISFYIALRYFLCIYILFKSEQTGIRRVIKASVRKMNDKKSEILTVVYSLVPSFLLCLLIIPAFVIVPYVVAVFTVYGTIYLKQFFVKQDPDKTIIFETGE